VACSIIIYPKDFKQLAMYKKEEYKAFKLEFWQAFDRYTKFFSRKVGGPVEWMLYKTGIKDLELKFNVQPKYVSVLLEAGARNFDRRLDNYKAVLLEGLGAGWVWDDSFKLESGKLVCRIYKDFDLSFHDRDKWPAIFEFMAHNMFGLQENFKEILPIFKEKFGKPGLDDFLSDSLIWEED
jgi:hypothetical protein